MARVATWAGAIAAIAIVIGVVRLVARDRTPAATRRVQAAVTARPQRPPGPDDPKPRAMPEPAMPVLSPEWKAQLADQVRGSPYPGEAAFRAVSERYVDENLAFAERKAELEGLTVAEVRELTYFGLMVLATQRTGEVEEMTGHPMTSDQRDALAELMQSANGEFQAQMRAAVARGAVEPERWALIRATEARYQAELFRITGLDAPLLDDLLFGNLALPGAPGRGELPAEAPTGGPRDEPIASERPRTMP